MAATTWEHNQTTVTLLKHVNRVLDSFLTRIFTVNWEGSAHTDPPTKDTALEEMARQAEALGANAVVGIDLDYETVGGSGSMLMVTCSGTAVRVE